MKLLYQGNGLDPQHVQRQRRRAWFCSVCWELQGFYGRTARDLINAGYCTLPERRAQG